MRRRHRIESELSRQICLCVSDFVGGAEGGQDLPGEQVHEGHAPIRGARLGQEAPVIAGAAGGDPRRCSRSSRWWLIWRHSSRQAQQPLAPAATCSAPSPAFRRRHRRARGGRLAATVSFGQSRKLVVAVVSRGVEVVRRGVGVVHQAQEAMECHEKGSRAVEPQCRFASRCLRRMPAAFRRMLLLQLAASSLAQPPSPPVATCAGSMAFGAFRMAQLSRRFQKSARPVTKKARSSLSFGRER